jgi:hypothetical protein
MRPQGLASRVKDVVVRVKDVVVRVKDVVVRVKDVVVHVPSAAKKSAHNGCQVALLPHKSALSNCGAFK